MALIENLEQEGWEAFFQDSFDYVLYVLKHDRFRHVGSSVDDLRSWLAAGGVAHARKRLNEQMEMRGFSPAQQLAVNTCFDELVQEHQGPLLDLIANGVLPATTRDTHVEL